jgi:hypothetical protein
MSKNEDKKQDKNPLDGCPIPIPVVDEAQLLADVRSPRFLEACKKLKIDPIELKPRSFDSVSHFFRSYECGSSLSFMCSAHTTHAHMHTVERECDPRHCLMSI